MEKNPDVKLVNCRLGNTITQLTEVSEVAAFKFKSGKPKNFRTLYNDLNKRYSIAPPVDETASAFVLKEGEQERFEKAGFIFVDAAAWRKSSEENARIPAIARNRRVFKYNDQVTLIETSTLFIKFEHGISIRDIERICAKNKLTLIGEFIPGTHLFKTEVADDTDILALSEKLSLHPDVISAEPDFWFQIESRYVPDQNPGYSSQWQFNNVKPGPNNKVRADVSAENAWTVTRGKGTKIAIIDIGFDPGIPDLSPNVVIKPNSGSGFFDVNGNFTLGVNNMPVGEHGTECACMAAAVEGSNSQGIGMAHEAQLILVCIDDITNFEFSAKAFAYAADPSTEIPGASAADGADVISCSLGFNDREFLIGAPLEAAIDFAASKGRNGRGIPIFWATDNDANPIEKDHAARLPNTVAVGRTSRLDRFNNSAYGPELDFVAPGVAVPLAQANYGWGEVTGASFATPLCAAIAALIISDKFEDTAEAKPKLLKPKNTFTWLEIRELIRSSAMPIDLEAGGSITWKDKDNNEIQNGNGVMQGISASDKLAVNTAANLMYLKVSNAQTFKPGQAILVGARTVLTQTAAKAQPGEQSSFIYVDQTQGFKVGQYITLRKYGNTVLNSDTLIAEGIPGLNLKQNTYIYVQDTRGFEVGDTIKIGEGVNIKTHTITTIHNHTRISISPVNAISTAKGSPVVLHPREPDETVEIIGITANKLETKPLLHDHIFGSRPTIVEIKDSETRIVTEIIDNDTLRIDSLLFAHQKDTPVQGGRFPHFSPAYGYGRVNAELAVKEALKYEQNYRDLMIRKHLIDDGSMPVNIKQTPISTPDIWVRITNPVDNTFSGDPAAKPADYNTPGPHIKPPRESDRWIYARIKNRGTKLSSLDFIVRFYLTITDGTPPDNISSFIQKDKNYSFSSGVPGSQLIGEVKVYNEARFAQPGNLGILAPLSLDPGNDLIVQVPWLTDKNKLPVAFQSPNSKTYILVEILPYDGVLGGSQVKNNNNICYKEINFLHDVYFQNQDGSKELRHTVAVESAPVPTPFRIVIEDLQSFDTGKVKVILTASLAAGGTETFVFSKAANGWALDNVNQTVISINAPVLSGGGPASGMQKNMLFSGNLQVTNLYKKIELQVTVEGSYTPHLEPPQSFVTLKRHEIILVKMPKPDDSAGLVQSPGPRFFAFTQADLLAEQLPEDAYGPHPDAPNDKFRLSSMFRPESPPSVIPAYAVVSGTVMVQRNLADQNLVNLILKPLRQSLAGFTPVKYFVYRGLKLTDFLKGISEQDEVFIRDNDANASAFIKLVYTIDESRAKSEKKPVVLPLNSKILGWEPATQLDEDLFDQFFYATDADVQLPVVTKGLELGRFYADNISSRFGIEIILEEGSYQPNLEYARLSEYEIDVSPLPALQRDYKREEILNFIDPAAYYGIHYSVGVEVPDALNIPGNKIKEGDLYTSFLSKFFTRNNLYLDVRNENGYSLNYYQNYKGPNPPININDQAQLNVGNAPGTLNNVSYGTNQWPVLIHNTPFNSTDSIYPFFAALRIDDNAKPIAYVDFGELTTESVKGKFVEGKHLIDVNIPPPRPFTKPMGFNVPAADLNGAKVPVAGIIKILYGRQISPPAIWPVKIARTTSYLDNLFGPVNIYEVLSKNSAYIEWLSSQDKRYVDATADHPAGQFGFMAERGVAHDDTRIIFYAVALDHFKRNGPEFSNARGLTNGTSTRGNFFDVAYAFQGLRLNITELGIWPIVKVLSFTALPDSGYSPDSILLLGITEDEFISLKDLPDFSPYHQKMIVPEKLSPQGGGEFVDSNNITYYKYKLKVTGWDNDGNFKSAYPPKDSYPFGDIEVFSLDGRILGSQAFANLQPIPVDYIANAEESRVITEAKRVDELMQLAPLVQDAANDFIQGINSIPNDASALQNLTAYINNNAGNILTNARNNPFVSDRALYWGRLKMILKVKQHPYCLGSTTERDKLVKSIEELTRGYKLANFPAGVKKVIIMGFDPMYLDTQIDSTNPSGAAAMTLNGKTITAGSTSAYVQSIILPARYVDLNSIITEIFKPIFQDNSVDLILSLGQNDSQRYFDLERFAASFRSGVADNENVSVNKPVGTGDYSQEFYETNLPVIKAVKGPFDKPAEQLLFYDQSYETVDGSHSHPVNGGANDKYNAFPFGALTGASRKGSAGNYLSNEVYYRLSRLRHNHTNSIKTGHLNIPAPQYTAPAMTVEQVVQRVKQFIGDCLESI